jgi:GT2 family glycosyltransferase
VLQRYSARDSRVRVLNLVKNQGIVGNTNAGLDEACGTFIAFVDHDDTLAPFALFEVVQLLNERPETDLIYSDSDLLSCDGSRRFQPLFKPDWSPAIMLSANYATHLCVVRANVLRAVGGLAEGTDGAQDWDMILRVSEQTQHIAHIPKVLYHWRESPVSTAIDISRKPYALQAQLDAIKRHLARTGLDADVFLDVTGYIRVIWPPTNTTLVSIIIPSRNLTLLRRCVDSIRANTSYRCYEIIVVDTTRDGEITSYYSDGKRESVEVIRFTDPFNYSAVNNLAAAKTRGDALLFLNDDTEVIDEDWLTELVRWIERDSVGVVGAKLLREDGRIQHAGVVIGLGGFADHPFAGGPEGQRTIYGNTEWYRNFSAVTGACLMIRRELFERIGGFDEQLALCGNDVELCLRVGRSGYQVVYTPFARLRHLESVTRGTAIPRDDFLHSFLHYRPLLVHGDPFYNPNLSGWTTLPHVRQPDEESALAFAERFLTELGLEVSAEDEQAFVGQGTVLE